MSEKLPYEFHVTVDALNTNTSEFIDTCSEIGAKAIVLDLGINNGTVLSDCMTSSTKLLENDNEAFCELYRIDDALSNKGFKVIRRKIETTPWHSLAPQTDGDLMPEGSYFESHLAIATTPEQISGLREGLIETADILPLHLSRNVFKKINDGKVIIMSTLRDYDSFYGVFAKRVLASQGRIQELGFAIIKPPITEFALYDSNTHQDDAWITRCQPQYIS